MKRRIFSVFFALVLVLSMSLVTAVPVAAEGEGYVGMQFQVDDLGTGEGSAGFAQDTYLGDYVVSLATGDPDASGQTDYAAVVLPCDLALSAVESFGYSYKLTDGNMSDYWDSSPYAVLELDTDEEPGGDTWVVHNMFAVSTAPHDWLSWNLGTVIPSERMVTGGGSNMWFSVGTVSGDYADWDAVTAIGGDVLKIKIAVGEWTSDINTAYLVDGFELNGTLYDLEPYVINEDSYEGFIGIQDAIDVASPYDTIQVYAGTYREYLHITTDGLTIEGAGIDESIIDLDGLIPYWHYSGSGSFASRAGVLISGYGSTDEYGVLDEVVEDVTFRGFTVQNAGLNPPITATGTHTGANDAAILTDSTKSWTPGALEGQWVHNYGDKDPADWNPARSYGQITANTATTVTVTLKGGVSFTDPAKFSSDYDWDTDDPYLITPYEEFHNTVWVHYPNYDALRGISIAGGKNVLIQHCKVINNGYGGISVGKPRIVSTYSEDVTIDHCTSSDHLVVGISIGNHKGAFTVTNNLVERNKRPAYTDPTRENSGRGIEVTGTSTDSAAGLIADNIVNDNGFEGIVLSKYSDGVVVEDNLVTGHNLDEDGAGIFFYGGWGKPEQCKNNIIRNNTVTGNIRGIIAYNAWNCTIESNTVTTDSGAFDSGQAAIKLDNAYNIEVKNNTINSPCDGVGIRVTSCNLDTLSYDNTFTGNTITAAKFAGVFISDGAHDNTFEYNTITGTTTLMRWEGKDYEDTQGDGVFIDDDAGTGNVFHWNNIYDNEGDGMENQVTTTTVDATENWWGDASGPSHSPGTGDKVAGNVLCFPWLLEPVVPREEPTTFDTTQVLKVGWTLVSTNNWIAPAQTFWDGVILAYNYTPSLGYFEVTPADLVPVDALYLKTEDGGGLGITYSGGVPVASSKDLEAGWNLISSATETDANAVLSPLQVVQIGQMVGPGLATLVSQGTYNWNTGDFYLATLSSGDWTTLEITMLNPFDGYWVYMNAAKNFGVIPQ